MGFSTVWHDDHSNALREYLADGKLSFSRISGELNARFGTRYSRNAVIGRAGRMGLNNHDRKPTMPNPARIRKRKPRNRIIQANGNSNRLRIIESEPFELRCVEITPRAISISQLEPDDCRYPYGMGAEITFCGHGPLHQQITFDRLTGESTKKTSSYCKAHHFLCVGPGTHSEQRANTVARELVA
jgi:GcrA cell cycle regulator